MIAFFARLWRRLFGAAAPALTPASDEGYRHPAKGAGTAPLRAPTSSRTPLWRFGRKCPLCGGATVRKWSELTGDHVVLDAVQGEVCGQTSRWRGWRRCTVPGVHLHQRCRACGATWVSEPPPNVSAEDA